MTDVTQTVTEDRNRWIALVVLCAGFLMIILDATIVNVALPSIQDDLGFSQASLAWVVNAYLIAFGGLLLLAGRLGDLIGRRRIFLVGLTIFTTASLLCGLASSQEVLIGARFLQGLGGALTSAVILGMIVTMFPEPREQAKAIGIYSFVASAGASIGLLAGGALTQAISWHWIFFVNVPIGIATAVLALRFVEDDEGIGLARGAHTLGFGAAAVALLAGFVVREARAATPLIPLRVFRSRSLSGASATIVLMVAGLFGMFFLGVLYLQQILGYDAIETGLAFLPVSMLIGVLSLGASARLNLRFGPRATLLPGLALVAAGFAYFSRAPVDGDYVSDVLPVMLALGVGAGLVFPALTTISMSAVLPSDAGLASGVVNTSMQVGGAFGLAVLATLASDRTETLLSRGDSTAGALTGGYQLAFLVAAAIVGAALLIAAAVLRSGPPVPQPDAAYGQPEPQPA